MTKRHPRIPALAVFAVSTIVMAGCTGSDEGISDSGTEALAGSEVKLYNWTDYMDPALLEKFTAETGIQVTLDTYDSNETLLAKLQAGGTGYDVIVPSDYMVVQMIELGLLQEINATALPNGDNIDPGFVDVYFDEGRRYTAPYQFGTTGIAYDPEATGTTLNSWADFFDPNNPAAGDIGTLNDVNEVVGAALRAVGAAPCSEDPADYERVQSLLDAWKPAVSVINSDNIIARMAAGEQSVHMMWNGAYHRASRGEDGNPDLEWVVPVEGLALWQDNFAVPVGAPNPEAAAVFIDWMLLPENAAALSNFVGYGNGITGAAEFLDAELANNPALTLTGEYAELAQPVPPCSTVALDFYDRVWTSFKE